MKKHIQSIYRLSTLLGLALAFASCEDVIDVELDESKSQLVVDAFINNLEEEQRIILSVSQPYFDASELVPAEGATVTVSNDKGTTITFKESDADKGTYVWSPGAGEALDDEGTTYTLSLSYGGQQYEAKSMLNPVPDIDSIHFEFVEEGLGNDEGFYAEFYARDFANRDDYYWISSTKNDTLVQDENFSLSVNAAFSGDGGDGFVFIPPVRFSITPEDPLKNGDEMKVELKSINRGTWNFLSDINGQGTGGNALAVLFSPPQANVRTNIENVNPKSDIKALGYFEISSVSRSERTLTVK